MGGGGAQAGRDVGPAARTTMVVDRPHVIDPGGISRRDRIVMPPHQYAVVVLREPTMLALEIANVRPHSNWTCSVAALWLMQGYGCGLLCVGKVNISTECVRLENFRMPGKKHGAWCPIRGLLGYEDFTKYVLAPPLLKPVRSSDGTEIVVAEVADHYETVIGKNGEKVAICELQGYGGYSASAYRQRFLEHTMLLRASRLAHDIVERKRIVAATLADPRYKACSDHPTPEVFNDATHYQWEKQKKAWRRAVLSGNSEVP